MAGFAGADRGKRAPADARNGYRRPTDKSDVSRDDRSDFGRGKSVFAAIQAKLVQAQADEYWRSFVGEEIFGNDDFGLLKHDIAAMARDGGRLKKTAIVALARKLLVALWKYVTAGVVIEGAIVKSA